MKRLYFVKKNIDKMLNYLETHTGLTSEELDKFGYEKSYYGSREYFDAYYARQYIAYDDYDRSQVTKTMLKDMKKFIDIAEKYGFIGDVWFNTGYNHGMYASTRTGKDIKSEIVLYHTFNTTDNRWKIFKNRSKFHRTDLTADRYISTIYELRDFITENNI